MRCSINTGFCGHKFGSLKINKQTRHLKWSQETRRGRSHTLPLNINCIPNRKRCTFSSPGEEGYYFTTQQEEGRISPCLATLQPVRDCHNSTTKKDSQFPPMDSVYNSPFQHPLLFYKRMFLSFVLQTCLWFPQIACPELQSFAVPR